MLALHRALLPDEEMHGLRTSQNWIGGSAWHPLDAEFIPPPPALVPELMNDLVRYIDSGLHAPLIQAALTPAQFETIHPFADGNGRVGWALIHTVLTRRGLTPTVVLPISVVLLTRQDGYAEGLTAYRQDGPSSSTAATTALSAWVELFLDATATAVDQASRFAADLAALRAEWNSRCQFPRHARRWRN